MKKLTVVLLVFAMIMSLMPSFTIAEELTGEAEPAPVEQTSEAATVTIDETEPVGEEAESAEEGTESAVEATELAEEETESAVEATEPAEEGTESAVEATEPAEEETGSAVEATEPAEEETESAVEATEPAAEEPGEVEQPAEQETDMEPAEESPVPEEVAIALADAAVGEDGVAVLTVITEAVDAQYRWQSFNTKDFADAGEGADEEAFWQDMTGETAAEMRVIGIDAESYASYFSAMRYRCVVTIGESFIVSNAARILFGEEQTGEDGSFYTFADGEQDKDLVNNQCFVFGIQSSLASGATTRSNYRVTNSAGVTQSISSVSYVSTTSDGYKVYRMNFSSPLTAGTYDVVFNNGVANITGSFTVSLYLRVVRVLDNRNLVIQLNSPVYGCTTGSNYFLHDLSGTTISVTKAVSCYNELGIANVFQLTTNRNIDLGTTYVVETRAMSLDAAGNRPCQGTIAYVTPSKYEPFGRITITNNQSIIVQFPGSVSGSTTASNYIIRNSSGTQMTVGNVRSLGSNKVEVNFSSPLTAGTYSLTTQNMSSNVSGSFTISLYLRVLRIETNSVIVQLNSPVYGCTTPSNYFIHRVDSSERISATSAVSVFNELGGQYPNVFRITLPTSLVSGKTYIIETKNMALDSNWREPCQGTIGYFTPETYKTVVMGINSVSVSAGLTNITKFVAPANGTYDFFSSGSEDTYGYLYNASLSQISSNDDGGTNRNFKISYSLSAGQVVYIGTKYYNSSKSGTVQLNIARAVGWSATDIGVSAGKTMLLRFTAPNSGTYQFFSTGSEDTCGYLYNASMSQISSNDDGGANRNFKISCSLSAGDVVYLGIKYYNTSTTIIHLQAELCILSFPRLLRRVPIRRRSMQAILCISNLSHRVPGRIPSTPPVPLIHV